MFKQGDWVKYKEESNPYRVDRVVGYNVYIHPVSDNGYQFGWVDYRALFSGAPQPKKHGEIMALDRDCTLIPPEVVDIMRGV